MWTRVTLNGDTFHAGHVTRMRKIKFEFLSVKIGKSLVFRSEVVHQQINQSI